MPLPKYSALRDTILNRRLQLLYEAITKVVQNMTDQNVHEVNGASCRVKWPTKLLDLLQTEFIFLISMINKRNMGGINERESSRNKENE